MTEFGTARWCFAHCITLGIRMKILHLLGALPQGGRCGTGRSAWFMLISFSVHVLFESRLRRSITWSASIAYARGSGQLT
jgi:hypothetical protein